MDRFYNAKLSDYDVNNLPANVIYCLCMDPKDENEYEMEYAVDYLEELKNFKDEQNNYVQEFLRILYSGRLERYKDLILSGIFDLKIDGDLYQESSIKEVELKAEEEYKRTIIQMLYTTMKANIEENKTLDVSITDIRDNKIKASNPNLSLAIERALLNEFIRLKLNETEMTIEEARVAMTNGEDIDFFFRYDDEHYSDYLIDDGKSLYFLPEGLTDDDVEYYAKCHTFPREVSYDLVSDVYEEFIINKEPFTKKKGARIINSALSSFVLKLSFLARFDSFISQNEIDDIWEYSISNKTCLLIYDLLSLFGGILRVSVLYAEDDKEKRTKYIRALLTREIDKNRDKYTDIINLINKVRRVKMGLDEFSIEDIVEIEDFDKAMQEFDELTEKYKREEL